METEAELLSEKVLGGGGCSCGGTCAHCSGGVPASSDLAAAAGPGRSMGTEKEAMESRFGRSFDDVLIHFGPEASQSARLLSARAFTVGRDVVFGEGNYSPDSPEGVKLLAHELAHVTQQSGADPFIQREDDARFMTITQAWAAALSDQQISRQMALLREHIAGLPENDVALPTARTNLLILQTETYRRSAGLSGTVTGVQEVGGVPRPPGLPADQGYSLVEIPDVPPGILDAMPEGRLLDSLPSPSTDTQPPWADPGAAPSSTDTGLYLAPFSIGAGTSAATLTTSAQQLSMWGYAAAGENAIGLVSFPQLGSQGHGFPQSRLAWGHTAVYVRVDGRIIILRSHAPSSLLGTLATETFGPGGVKTGALGVPGSVYSDVYTPGRGIPMFTHTGARSIEFPVGRGTAAALSESLPDVGPSSTRYTGVPAQANLCQGVNCVRWAVPIAEEALGGQFGPLNAQGAPTSIVDLGKGNLPGGAVNQASQGRMYSWMGEAATPGRQVIGWDSRTGTQVVATLADDGRVVVNALPEEALGAPVVGEMSRGMKYLRWGGRVFFVAGIVLGGAEIALATPEHRARTAVGVTAGFAGGWAGGAMGGAAAGAAAGLVCGPGAPVCSTVLAVGGAIVGGFLGGFGARSMAEFLFDYDREAYRANVGEFMSTLRAKTQGHFEVGPDGVARWVAPDPRYAMYAGAIQRFESGESGGCQTCHDINAAWGRTADLYGDPMPGDPMPGDPPTLGGGYQGSSLLLAPPRRNVLTDEELRRISEWIGSSQ